MQIKPSRYNLFLDGRGDQKLLYNTLYGSLTQWGPDEMPTVESLLACPREGRASTEIFRLLTEQKHLVSADSDEVAIVRRRRELGVADPNRLDVVIMPTLDCNFRCPYCYETRRPIQMTNAVSDRLGAWLQHNVPRHAVTLLHWYGGEPLLEWRRVIAITRKASDAAMNAGTQCIVHVTTNGYLLTPPIARKLVAAGIHDYQVTVDGPPDTHDKTRVLINGRGTFIRVFENIIKTLSMGSAVRITLRINFNHLNLSQIPRLLEMFPARCRGQLRVTYEPIFGDCRLSADANCDKRTVGQDLASYYALAQQLGYNVELGISGIHTGKLVYCYAERVHQYIIGPTADVFKCSVSDFDPSRRVGSIGPGGSFSKEEGWDTWMESGAQWPKICIACVYLPLCMGGCRKARVTKGDGESECQLIPTNASYLLKQVAYGNLSALTHVEA